MRWRVEGIKWGKGGGAEGEKHRRLLGKQDGEQTERVVGVRL